MHLDPLDSRLSPKERADFHAPHLARVSRSFAFGISRLEPDLRASVGLGYLICRLLDTIEDGEWLSRQDQITEFDNFETAMNSGECRLRVPESATEGEKALANDAAKIFAEFHKLERAERDAMFEPIMSMCRGMREYADRGLRLSDLSDVNTYCFFVAGVVGELLTGLAQPQMLTQIRPIGLERGVHFGLFLQKVNVLKDEVTDLSEGRVLVPNRDELFHSLKENALEAFNYLVDIDRRDYRLFCAWALFLGLATIPLLRLGQTKLPRLQALALGARIELAVDDTAKLKTLFDELMNKGWTSKDLPTVQTVQTVQTSTSDVRGVLERNYSGRIDLDVLESLLHKPTLRL